MVFKKNCLNYLLDLNILFLLFSLIILVIYSILLSNTFNLLLFKFYLEIKSLIKTLNEINVAHSLQNEF